MANKYLRSVLHLLPSGIQIKAVRMAAIQETGDKKSDKDVGKRSMYTVRRGIN